MRWLVCTGCCELSVFKRACKRCGQVSGRELARIAGTACRLRAASRDKGDDDDGGTTTDGTLSALVPDPTDVQDVKTAVCALGLHPRDDTGPRTSGRGRQGKARARAKKRREKRWSGRTTKTGKKAEVQGLDAAFREADAGATCAYQP